MVLFWHQDIIWWTLHCLYSNRGDLIGQLTGLMFVLMSGLHMAQSLKCSQFILDSTIHDYCWIRDEHGKFSALHTCWKFHHCKVLCTYRCSVYVCCCYVTTVRASMSCPANQEAGHSLQFTMLFLYFAHLPYDKYKTNAGNCSLGHTHCC